jgi:Winged helix DNA-binding domain
VTIDRLTEREIARATLARQLLLRRSDLRPLAAVQHLLGLQAQLPLNPYTSLWSRLRRFDPESLSDSIRMRDAVRIVVMRGTLHLVTADDCLIFRPFAQPVLDREIARHPEFAPALVGIDTAPVFAFVTDLLAERPHTGPELRDALRARFPTTDAAALAYACRNHLALVHAPPRGLWGASAQIRLTTAESWLGRPLATVLPVDDIVRRYLGAFGPATPSDFGAWCGLGGARELFDRLRPELRLFHDDRGRELFDLADGVRPHADVPCPPRVLPEYDNVLLSHADRRRFVSDDERRQLSAGRTARGNVLDDGRVAATWSLARDPTQGRATLTVHHLSSLRPRRHGAIEREALAFLRFSEAASPQHDVRIVPL